MEEEREITLSRIAWNLSEHSISFETADDLAAVLSFRADGRLRLFFNPGLAQRSADRLIDKPAREAGSTRMASSVGCELCGAPPNAPHPEACGSSPVQGGKEKDSSLTLTGRLKSNPKEGRPDSAGRSTAWARFAAHEEDEDAPHLYLATFHRHTRPLVLTLKTGDQLTVEGFVHRRSSTDRLDTLSIFAIHDYPGKRQHRAAGD